MFHPSHSYESASSALAGDLTLSALSSMLPAAADTQLMVSFHKSTFPSPSGLLGASVVGFV